MHRAGFCRFTYKVVFIAADLCNIFGGFLLLFVQNNSIYSPTLNKKLLSDINTLSRGSEVETIGRCEMADILQDV